MNSIWKIISILTGCNLFPWYFKNGKMYLKRMYYLKIFISLATIWWYFKCNVLLSLEKLNFKDLYLIQLIRDFCKPASPICLKNICVLDRKYIYILPRIVTFHPYTRYLQYKVFNNVLYLNKKILFWYIWNFPMLYLEQK